MVRRDNPQCSDSAVLLRWYGSQSALVILQREQRRPRERYARSNQGKMAGKRGSGGPGKGRECKQTEQLLYAWASSKHGVLDGPAKKDGDQGTVWREERVEGRLSAS